MGIHVTRPSSVLVGVSVHAHFHEMQLSFQVGNPHGSLALFSPTVTLEAVANGDEVGTSGHSAPVSFLLKGMPASHFRALAFALPLALACCPRAGPTRSTQPKGGAGPLVEEVEI